MLVKPLIYYLAAVSNRTTSKGHITDCVGAWFMLLLKGDLIDYATIQFIELFQILDLSEM